MELFLTFNKKTLRYTDQGTGKAIVLLHGYLESLEIWEDFAKALSESARVICIDLPGHGNSEIISEKQSIKDIAKSVYQLLDQLNVTKCFMIGHSMGGYVTLMFHKLYSNRLDGFSLFHSHPFSDSVEVKNKRIREIELVKNGKKDLIAQINIPNAFANENLKSFNSQIKKSTDIAMQTSEKGMIANLYAMMNRPDLSRSLFKSKVPFLYILGKKDNYINYIDTINKIKYPKKSQVITLTNSGHMGFIEEKEKSLKIINIFLNSL